jgi:hypothetical protein
VIVDQVEVFASKKLLLERGPVAPARATDRPCGMTPTETRCEPTMQWIESPSTPSAKFLSTCGFKDTQYYADILEPPDNVALYPDTMPVESACHCAQLCALHLPFGCWGYKYYEAEVKHCVLLQEPFEAGKGWYGTKSDVWPGWTSSGVSRRYVSNGKMMEKPWLLSFSASVAASTPFTLTVHGVGLTMSDTQRLKVVRQGAGCATAVPPEIGGVACVPTMVGGEAVYVFCGPGPKEMSTTSASWDVTLMGGEEYDVCYCAFDCSAYSRWQLVPGTLSLSATPFTWSAASVPRSGSQIAVKLWRPAFGSASSNRGWRLKVIRDLFTCDLDMSPIFGGNLSDPLILEPVSCTGPDLCDFELTVDVGFEDVGSYLVCFVEELGDAWVPLVGRDSTTVSILPLSTDHEKPTGIYHSHVFSAQAGGKPATLEVGGNGLVMNFGKITLTKNGCGGPYEFKGSAVPLPAADAEAPFFAPEDTLPTNNSVVSDTQVLSLAFSELVKIPEGCTGRFMLFEVGTSMVGIPKVSCDCSSADILVYDNRIILPPPGAGTLPVADLYVVIETGALEDLHGNRITLMDSAPYSFTVSASPTKAPSVLTTTPDHMTYTDGTVVRFFFDEVVTLDSGELRVRTCAQGDEPYKCSPTDEVVKYIPLDSSMYSGAVVKVDLGKLRPGRYQVILPGNSSVNAAGIVEAEDELVEFVYEPAGWMRSNAFAVDVGSSSVEGFEVTAALSADTEPGIYDVCYCDEQEDASLETLGAGEFTYDFKDDTKCGTSTAQLDAMGGDVAGLPLSEHTCEAKCGMGCIGPHCFCDGYESAGSSSTLCLSRSLCAEACAQSEYCDGFSVHDDLPLCELTTACAASTELDWVSFTKVMGASCTHFDDFREKIGVLTVTARVEVGVDYVFTPGVEGSLELTTPTSFANVADALSADRIMVIDCGGTCGVSGPTEALEGADTTKVSYWASKYAHEFNFKDFPADDQDAGTKHDHVMYAITTNLPSRVYTARKGAYIPSNLDLSTLSVVLEGKEVSVEEHQCFKKCAVSCTGEHCYCDGYLSGFDTKDSNALCASQDFCEHLCDASPSCGSIDMHTTINRCYLNSKDVSMNYGDMLSDSSYMVLVPRTDANYEIGHDSVEGPVPDPTIEAEDHGYSWDKLLRFNKITFKTGGTFKLCFCDSSIQKTCSSKKDYSVQVGKIHASGVSCLIQEKSLRKASCVEQFHGSSLRCYSGDAPHVELPMLPTRPAIELPDPGPTEFASTNGVFARDEEK